MKQRCFLLALPTLLAGTRAQPQHADKALQPGTMQPTLIRKVEPKYTHAALDAHVQGNVLLRMVIDQAGVPREIAVLSPLGFGLDENAVQCVSDWRFRPAMKENKPVSTPSEVLVNFRLLGTNFDAKAEERRMQFNSIVSRLHMTKDAKPSAQDVAVIQDLARHKLPGAQFAFGLWQFTGDSVPKDPDAGLANIQKAADKNYGPALFFIGREHLNGNVLPKDPAKGLAMIRDAAVLGSKDAQLLLGDKYERADGVEVDLDRAKRYFRLCAAAGTPECQFRLGRLLLAAPHYTEPDQAQAVAWLELAKDHGLEAARALAGSEAAKLTPEQTRWVMRLKPQLERKP